MASGLVASISLLPSGWNLAMLGIGRISLELIASKEGSRISSWEEKVEHLIIKKQAAIRKKSWKV
jgi:hypothetical protein